MLFIFILWRERVLWWNELLVSYVYILASVLLGIFIFYLVLFILGGRKPTKEVSPFASGEYYKSIRIPYRVNFIYYIALFAAFETFAVLIILAFIARVAIYSLIYFVLVSLAFLMAPKVIAK